MLAEKEELYDIVQLLIARKAKVNKSSSRDESPLIAAAAGCVAGNSNNTIEIVILISKRANVNHYSIYGMTPLITAAKAGNIAVVQLLLNKGANINHTSGNGHTALLLATYNRHFDIVQLLIDESNIHLANNMGDTAMILAAKWGQNQLLLGLLEKGARINDCNIQYMVKHRLCVPACMDTLEPNYYSKKERILTNALTMDIALFFFRNNFNAGRL